MNSTLLVSSAGLTATLGSLATVTEVPGQTEILRDNLQRDVPVTARLEGVDLGTGVAAVQKTVRDMKLPPSDTRRSTGEPTVNNSNRSTI